MNKKGKTVLFIGGGLVAAIGVYFGVKAFSKKKDDVVTENVETQTETEQAAPVVENPGIVPPAKVETTAPTTSVVTKPVTTPPATTVVTNPVISQPKPATTTSSTNSTTTSLPSITTLKAKRWRVGGNVVAEPGRLYLSYNPDGSINVGSGYKGRVVDANTIITNIRYGVKTTETTWKGESIASSSYVSPSLVKTSPLIKKTLINQKFAVAGIDLK